MTISERKAREKELRRVSIMEAAEELFAKEGYHTTTMEQVAEKAELSKGTLYLYFENKDDLFFTILQEKVDAHTCDLKEELERAGNLKETIIKLVTEQLDFFEENHHFFRLSISEQCKIEQTPGSVLRQHFIAKQISFLSLVEEALSEQMKLKDSYPFSPRSLALCLIGATHAHMMNWMMAGGVPDLRVSRDEIIQIILNGVGFKL